MELIFEEDTIKCKCGFEGNIHQIQKHFKKKWSLIKGTVEKNSHVKIG